MNINNPSGTIANIQNMHNILIEHGHAFGNIHNTMEILQFQKKGTYLNTIERFHIYKETIQNNHLNDEYTTTANKIFDTVLQHLQ